MLAKPTTLDARLKFHAVTESQYSVSCSSKENITPRNLMDMFQMCFQEDAECKPCLSVVAHSQLKLDTQYRYLYNNEPYTGLAKIYSDEKLIVETTFQEGLKHGRERRWYHQNPKQLYSERYFSANVPQGMSLRWYPNGQVKLEELFEFGISVLRRTWDPKGTMIINHVLSHSEISRLAAQTLAGNNLLKCDAKSPQMAFSVPSSKSH